MIVKCSRRWVDNVHVHVLEHRDHAQLEVDSVVNFRCHRRDGKSSECRGRAEGFLSISVWYISDDLA